MAKKLNRIELAFTRFDDITKRHLDRIEKNYKDFGGIPEVKQKKKKSSIFSSPFGRIQ